MSHLLVYFSLKRGIDLLVKDKKLDQNSVQVFVVVLEFSGPCHLLNVILHTYITLTVKF